MKRTAVAKWQGSGKEGKGTLSTQSNSLHETQYSFTSRFEEGTGTNPEELIAAAHAGCFTMKLSFNLSGADFIPDLLETKCVITLEEGKVTRSQLTLNAKVPKISADKFKELVEDAKLNCPISKLLDTEILLDYNLA